MRKTHRTLLALAVGVVAGSPGAAAQAPPARAAQIALTIGGDNVTDERLTFAKIRTVAVDGEGRIYVLDATDCVVKVFDSRGAFVRSFGRKGAGPGEFTEPAGLVLTPSGVRVNDRGGHRRVEFTFAGQHVRTTPDTTSAVVPELPLRYGLMLRVIQANVSSETGVTPATTLVVSGRALPRPDTLARIPSGHVAWTRDGSFGLISSGFGDGGTWTLSGDSVLAIVNGYTGGVTWYAATPTGAKVTRQGTLGRTGRTVTSSERSDVEERARRFGSVRPSDIPRQWSIADRALFDVAGGLWVRTPGPIDKPAIWTVLPARGPSFTLELPMAFTLSAVRGPLLFGHTQTGDGTPVVRVYRLM